MTLLFLLLQLLHHHTDQAHPPAPPLLACAAVLLTLRFRPRCLPFYCLLLLSAVVVLLSSSSSSSLRVVCYFCIVVSQGVDRNVLRAKFLQLEEGIRSKEVQYQRLLEDAESAMLNLDREFKDHIGQKKTWLANLNTMVSNLNTKFDQLMRQIGYVGRWELGGVDASKNEADTKLMELSIHLTASFTAREDGLVGNLLQMPRLSGGETSVTTFVALLAVQQHFPAPFRIADEVRACVPVVRRQPDARPPAQALPMSHHQNVAASPPCVHASSCEPCCCCRCCQRRSMSLQCQPCWCDWLLLVWLAGCCCGGSPVLCRAHQIDQGMDETNRWLTMKLLTDRPHLASPTDGRQFFILTPKLLRQISCV